MEEKHKLKMKIGAFEFEAEGDKASVDEQMRRFLEIVEKSPAKAPPAKAPPVAPPPGGNEGAGGGDQTAPDQALFDRTFKNERGVISLHVLPKTKSFAADALLLLLYAFQKLKGEHQVLGGHLMHAGRQSGLQIDRVDRVLSLHGEYYNKGGTRKGARYSLNNRGIQKAEEILNGMHT